MVCRWQLLSTRGLDRLFSAHYSFLVPFFSFFLFFFFPFSSFIFSFIFSSRCLTSIFFLWIPFTPLVSFHHKYWIEPPLRLELALLSFLSSETAACLCLCACLCVRMRVNDCVYMCSSVRVRMYVFQCECVSVWMCAYESVRGEGVVVCQSVCVWIVHHCNNDTVLYQRTK